MGCSGTDTSIFVDIVYMVNDATMVQRYSRDSVEPVHVVTEVYI